MGAVLTVIVVIAVVLFAIKVMSGAVEAARLLSEAERAQIRDAVLINFGGPCMASIIDQRREDIFHHRRRVL